MKANRRKSTNPEALQHADQLIPSRYTSKDNLVYAMVLSWPEEDVLTLGSVRSTPQTHVAMLAYKDDHGSSSLEFTILDDGIAVTFPAMSRVASQWAWVLVFHGIEPA